MTIKEWDKAKKCDDCGPVKNNENIYKVTLRNKKIKNVCIKCFGRINPNDIYTLHR